jgi:hypothetical protein
MARCLPVSLIQLVTFTENAIDTMYQLLQISFQPRLHE